jgi:hypothetical protein
MALSASLALLGASGPQLVPPLDLDPVLQRVGSYVEQYQEEFSRLVCEERYAQEASRVDLAATRRADVLHSRQRRLVSEFALARMQVGADRIWLGFRDVLEVDGRPVSKERHRLEALFLSSPADLHARARAIADESARYNLGQYRTINVPTLALEFFARGFQVRQWFEKTGEDTLQGVRTWRVGFRELAVPTVIQTPEGADVPSRGVAWVDPVTGRVVRTQIEPQFAAPQKSKIVVTYAHDPRLSLWVPARMEESYQAGEMAVTGTAAYSNCRRFETTARIKD